MSCDSKDRKWQVVAITRRGSGKWKEFSRKQNRVQQQLKQSPAANKKELIIELPLWIKQMKEESSVQTGPASLWDPASLQVPASEWVATSRRGSGKQVATNRRGSSKWIAMKRRGSSTQDATKRRRGSSKWVAMSRTGVANKLQWVEEEVANELQQKRGSSKLVATKRRTRQQTSCNKKEEEMANEMQQQGE